MNRRKDTDKFIRVTHKSHALLAELAFADKRSMTQELGAVLEEYARRKFPEMLVKEG